VTEKNKNLDFLNKRVDEMQRLELQHDQDLDAAHHKIADLELSLQHECSSLREEREEKLKLGEEQERLKLALQERDDTIHDLYRGRVFMIQTRRTGPNGSGWSTIGCFTDYNVASKQAVKATSEQADVISRVVIMQLNTHEEKED
jgi:hypothetical protein